MRVSIIIPVYNRRELLQEALESLKNQQYQNFQLIIADDGSTDGSAETAESWIREYGKGAFLALEHCGFPGKVRNRAAELARGEWIAFLDSDDLWMPEKLQQQLEAADKTPNIRIWHCRETWLRGDKIISQRKLRHQRQGHIFEDALKKCIIGPSTVLIRRDLWVESGGFREDMEIAEDYELWLRITAREQVGYLDQPLIVKRAGDWEQLSEKYGQIEIFRMQGLRDLVDRQWFRDHADADKQQQAREELLRKYQIYAQGCRKRGREEEARIYETLAER